MNVLRKGLKDVGVDALLGGKSSTLESEDDEADDDDSKDFDGGMLSKEHNDDPTKSPYGAKALTDAFLGPNESDDEKNKEIADYSSRRSRRPEFVHLSQSAA
jgi:hypothetical protein